MNRYFTAAIAALTVALLSLGTVGAAFTGFVGVILLEMHVPQVAVWGLIAVAGGLSMGFAYWMATAAWHYELENP